MSYLMIDTNVLLDAVLENRPDSDEACEVLNLCNGEGDLGMACSLSLKDAYYLASKQVGKDRAREIVRALMGLVVIAPIGSEECNMSIDGDEPDFEDGLIRAAAELNGADYIITRDVDAFKHSPIPSVTAPEYLAIFEAQDKALISRYTG